MKENNHTEYSTVEAKVRHIVSSMGHDVAYLFCNWAQANVEIDNVNTPTIVYVLPANGEFNFVYGQAKDYPETFLAFICPTDFDFNGHKNDNVIEQMKRLAVRFIKALNESGLFEQIYGRIKYRVLYDFLDRNVTGIVITPQIEEIEGIRMCDIIARPEDTITITGITDE